MSVFVLDRRKKPLMPCSEKRARLLIERGRAVVVRRYPFTIRFVQGVSHRHCTLIQRADGYAYFPNSTIALNKQEDARLAA